VVGNSDAIQGDDRLFRTAIRRLGFSVFRYPYNSRSSHTDRTDALGATVGGVDDSRVAEPLEPDEPRRTAAAVNTLVAVVAAGLAVQILEIGVVLGKQATSAYDTQTSDYGMAFFGGAASVQDLAGQGTTCVFVRCLLRIACLC